MSTELSIRFSPHAEYAIISTDVVMREPLEFNAGDTPRCLVTIDGRVVELPCTMTESDILVDTRRLEQGRRYVLYVKLPA